jgi:hypothetical protein
MLCVFCVCVCACLSLLMFVLLHSALVCASVYTAEEAFGRLLLFHCSIHSVADAHVSFDWRSYVLAKQAGDELDGTSAFTPDAEVLKVYTEVLTHGLFVKVVVRNLVVRGSRDGRVTADRWRGYQLQKACGSFSDFVLAPFEARVTREECALRLALESCRHRVRWDFFAARETWGAGQIEGVLAPPEAKRARLHPASPLCASSGTTEEDSPLE